MALSRTCMSFFLSICLSFCPFVCLCSFVYLCSFMSSYLFPLSVFSLFVCQCSFLFVCLFHLHFFHLFVYMSFSSFNPVMVAELLEPPLHNSSLILSLSPGPRNFNKISRLGWILTSFTVILLIDSMDE